MRRENQRAAAIELARRKKRRALEGDTESKHVLIPELLNHQKPPTSLEGWNVHVLFGGRGAGKSLALSAAAYEHMMGPPCDPSIPGGHRGIFLGPTLGDVGEAFESPAGLQAIDPNVKMITRRGGTIISFPNGGRLRALGCYTKEDATRLRAASNNCCVFIEELAACRQLARAWSNMRLALRVGPWRKIFAATTPQAKPFVRNLLDDPKVSLSRATMFDNPFVPEEFKQEMLDSYEGTRLYRQEILGELMKDVFGALWTAEEIDASRIPISRLLATDHARVFEDLLMNIGSPEQVLA